MNQKTVEEANTEAEALRRLYAGKTLTPAEKMKIPAQEMPNQEASVRARNMEEVALGYSEAQAVVEASRCLQCKNAPCVKDCPVHINIPEFLKAVAEENFKEGLKVIRRDSLLPAMCGRVCPQETQCQKNCTMGKALKDVDKAVSIGRVERFLADNVEAEPVKTAPETGKKVLIIGSGPAGITCAADCRKAGHRVVICEALNKPGGVTVYGIPEFRLPKAIVEKEIENLKKAGVEIRPDFLVGKTRKLKDLMDKEGFDAAFIAVGAGLPVFAGVEGENLVGVFAANEYLTRSNLMKAYDKDRALTPMYTSKRVAILGGGNVAMDAARTAVRMGAEKVSVIYRRTEKEMPARKEEVQHAKEEGVEFLMLKNISRIIGDENGRVKQVETVSFELGEPDASGRRSPVRVDGSEELLEFDTVIIAIGSRSNPLIRQTVPEIRFNEKGNIIVDENMETSLKNVFAGGDIVLGAATVISAMGQGREAAKAINERLKS